jgi:hypothetical protein
MSQLNVDIITNKLGTGAPSFPNGITVTGTLTGTASTAQGLTGTPNITVGSVTGTSATFSGNVSVGGTLTYEDVTNIDSVGLVTARTGVRVTDGGLIVTGVSTFNNGVAVTGVSTFNNGVAVTGVSTFNNGVAVTGVSTFNNDVRLRGVVENVSAATTYTSGGALVLELDVRNSTTYRYTMVGGNIGIVSFKNMPADTENGSTVTVLFTQQSSTPSGVGNTTAATGIGTNCTVIPFVGGSAIAGISTRGLVGSATTVTLSTTASDVDFVSFYVHYTGATSSAASSYKVYVTKNGGFRQGIVGV